jgi:DeoR family glycerol-3-phosphate regulon repressor
MNRADNRRKNLLDFLNKRGYATIEELAQQFDVTPQTMRRDITQLADEGLVQRFHGGVGMPLGTENIIYDQRKLLFTDEKRRIAALVAEHIPDGASICINIGTTTEAVAYALLEKKNLRVLTNNLNVARICAGNPTFEVIIAGGTVRSHDLGVIGTAAESFMREFRMDFGIIGISGIDEEGNLLDYDYREVTVARTIIARSRRVFLVCDNSKFGRPAMVSVGHVEQLEAVFSNGPLGDHWKNMLKQAGTQLFLA